MYGTAISSTMKNEKISRRPTAPSAPNQIALLRR